MRKVLPYPGLSLSLAAIWLLFNQTLAPGQMIVGAILGVVLGLAVRKLDPPRLRMRRHWKLVLLALQVAGDIIRSNIAVAQIILFGRSIAQQGEPVTSGFVWIPLTLKNRYGLMVLACIITSTPGTIWVSYDPARSLLLIHVLDLLDEEEWIERITQRYERPLLEVFQ